MAPRYLLDTNVLSEPMRPLPDPRVLERMAAAGGAIATAAPAWHEIDFGRRRLPNGKRRRAIDAIAAELEGAITILPYDAAAAGWHARERARLSRRGRVPGFVDGQIAAVAAVHGLVLVTRNVRDFDPFDEVIIEDWSRP